MPSFFRNCVLVLLLNVTGVFSDCLQGCSCSTSSYSCYNYRLSTIDESLFTDYPELSQIIIIGSSLVTLPVGLFRGLTRLQELKLQNNRFASLPPGIFAGLSSLTRVTLSYNALEFLPGNIFYDAEALNLLHLDHNKISSLPVDIFANTSSLSSIDASDNRIAELDHRVFKALTKLQSLSLAQNRLTAVEPGTFHGLISLQSLSLAANQISSLPVDSFGGLPKLHSLHLYGNRLCGYGTALSPEGVAASIAAEVKHKVDVIFKPQTADCASPPIALCRTTDVASEIDVTTRYGLRMLVSSDDSGDNTSISGQVSVLWLILSLSLISCGVVLYCRRNVIDKRNA